MYPLIRPKESPPTPASDKNSRGHLRPWLLAAILLVYAEGALGASLSTMPPFEEGYTHARVGAWERAAETWVSDGETALKKSRKKEDLQDAAFFNLLATIAFEKANNARAYVTWSAMIRYFLEGGTSWSAQQESLRLESHTLASSLKARPPGSPPMTTHDTHLRFLEMVETFHLTTYQGPARNLRVRKIPDEAPEIHVTRHYFPRPKSMQGEEVPLIKKRGRQIIAPSYPASSIESPSVLPGKPMIPASQASLPRAEKGPKRITEMPLVPPLPAGADTEMSPAPLPIAIFRGESQETSHLTSANRDASRTAWRYFIENYQANTGLVNSVHNYPYATLWDMGSNLAAYVCALQLKLIPPTEGEAKITRLLETLQEVELYNEELPNREYNTKTGEMIDLNSRPSSRGSGWSALDIGRLLIWLKITASWYPDFAPLVEKVMGRWTFDRLVQYRELNGVAHDGRKEWLRQEGRLGYEQYAAMGLKVFGFDVRNALDYKETAETSILERTILYDTRNKAYLTSDPFLMAKMEVGIINETFTTLTDNVYDIQRRRWLKSQALTAVNEDSINKEPWFVYNTLFYEGSPWVCVTHEGTPAPTLSTLSTKAALGWSALFDDAYARALRQAVIGLSHPRHGFYAGIFENGEINTSKNINTNAMILETMLYIKRKGDPFLYINN